MKKIKKVLLILFLLTIFVSKLSFNVYASNGVVSIDDFNNLSGDAIYLGEDYRDNYYLDMEDLGILDTGYQIMNNMANVLFGFVCTIAYITVSLFYFGMDFDVSSLLAPQISAIQESLNSGIFRPLFLLALFGTMMNVAVRLWRRDLVGVGAELAKVIAVVLLSIFVIRDSSTAISYSTEITKGLSVSILNGVNESYGGGASGSGYAAQSSGILWINLVHEPWKTLQFGSHVPSDSEVESFLEKVPGEDVRQDLVDNFSPKSSFAKNRGAERIGFCLAYLIPFLVKCGIYLIVTLIQIVFQLLAILFVLLAALILILALIPGYGVDIISIWFKKILETQISILIISFIMALLVRIDELIYSLSPVMGWFPVLIFQVGIGVGLLLFRDKLLYAFSNIQRSVQNSGQVKAMLQHAGNPYETTQRHMREKERRRAIKTIASANRRNNTSFSKSEAMAAKLEEERPVMSSGRKAAEPVKPNVKAATKKANYSDESWNYIMEVAQLAANQKHQSGSGGTAARPVIGQGQQPESREQVARPVTSQGQQPGFREQVARSVTGQGQQPGFREQVARPVTSQGQQPGSGTQVARPVSSQEQQPGSGAVAARPVSSQEQQSGSGAVAARPVSSQEQQPGSGAVAARLVSSQEQQSGSGAVAARPVSSQDLQPGSGAVAARPVSSQEQQPGSGAVAARPVSSQGQQPGSGIQAARPVSSQELQPGAGAPAIRPVNSQGQQSRTNKAPNRQNQRLNSHGGENLHQNKKNALNGEFEAEKGIERPKTDY